MLLTTLDFFWAEFHDFLGFWPTFPGFLATFPGFLAIFSVFWGILGYLGKIVILAFEIATFRPPTWPDFPTFGRFPRFGQIRPDSARFGQISRPDLARFGQIRPDSARFGQIRPDSARFGQIPGFRTILARGGPSSGIPTPPGGGQIPGGGPELAQIRWGWDKLYSVTFEIKPGYLS